ncbi:unnamed protein product [Dicrocoelium dendriticum]|nr:unnamed protein product [Dicrocoelium dendriticum]
MTRDSRNSAGIIFHCLAAPPKITCHSSWLDLQAVPDDPSGLHYSDYEGLGASFPLTQPAAFDKAAISNTAEPSKLEPLLLEMRERIVRGLRICRKMRQFHLSISLLMMLLALMLPTCLPHSNLATNVVGMFTFVIIGATLFALVWGSIVGRTTERRALENAVQTINVWLSCLPSSVSNGLKTPVPEAVPRGDVL